MNNKLFYKNCYNHTKDEKWHTIANLLKVKPLIIIGFVEKLKDISASSVKRGLIERDDIGKVAYRNMSIKKADKIFDALIEVNFIIQIENEDLFCITNWEKYQGNFKNNINYNHTINIDETKEEKRKRQTREAQAHYRAKQKLNNSNQEVIKSNHSNQIVINSNQSHIDNPRDLEPKNLRIKESLKKNKQKKECFEKEIEIPEFIDKNIWNDWVNCRKEQGKPLKNTTISYQLKELIKFHEDGFNVNQIIEKSILKSWSGFFKPNENFSNSLVKNNQKEDKIIEMLNVNNICGSIEDNYQRLIRLGIIAPDDDEENKDDNLKVEMQNTG